MRDRTWEIEAYACHELWHPSSSGCPGAASWPSWTAHQSHRLHICESRRANIDVSTSRGWDRGVEVVTVVVTDSPSIITSAPTCSSVCWGLMACKTVHLSNDNSVCKQIDLVALHAMFPSARIEAHRKNPNQKKHIKNKLEVFIPNKIKITISMHDSPLISCSMLQQSQNWLTANVTNV